MSLQPPRPGRAGPRGPCGSARRSQPGPAGGGGGARTAAAPGGAGGLSTGPGPAGGSRGRLSRGPRSWAGAGAPRRLRETRRFLRGWASCRSGLGYQPWATAPVTLTCSGIYCEFLLMTGRGNNKSPPVSCGLFCVCSTGLPDCPYPTCAQCMAGGVALAGFLQPGWSSDTELPVS